MKIRLGRIGQFFFFIGIILLVVFFATDQNKSFQPGFFFFGLVLSFLGVYLMTSEFAHNLHLAGLKPSAPFPCQGKGKELIKKILNIFVFLVSLN